MESECPARFGHGSDSAAMASPGQGKPASGVADNQRSPGPVRRGGIQRRGDGPTVFGANLSGSVPGGGHAQASLRTAGKPPTSGRLNV